MRRGSALTALMCGLALSAYSLAGAPSHFDIPAGDLISALDLLARQSHVEFIYSADDLKGLRTGGVRGDMTAETAVHKLLEGTDLAVNVHPSGAILIARNRTLGNPPVPLQAPAKPPHTAAPSAKESHQVEEIVVRSTAEGLVATRMATPLREIPQTVALITSEQMRQLNDTDLADALAHTPGITVVRTDSLDESFYARGFKITSFHVDGGAALFSVTGFQQLDTAPALTVPFLGTTDLSEFDHIEVLRGADALFASNGNPGATVSLVRKRPLRTPQLTLDAWVGSWNNTRVEADATGPLAFDGALRGRMDGLYTDRDYFYDIGSFRRKKLFAALDYDLTPATLLTVGGSYQWDDAVPFVSGLPRNQDGSDPHLSRKTAFTFHWAEYQTRTGEFYLQLRQQLGTSWKLTINATAWNGTVENAYGTFSSQVDPLTGGLLSPPTFAATPRPNTQHQFASDITLTGTQDWFGHHEELAIGADYTRARTRLIADQFQPTQPLVTNVFAYDPVIYADPRTTLNPLLRFDITAVERRAGLFSSLRVYLRDDLSVVGGARFSGNRTETALTNTVGGLSGSASVNYGNSAVITPYGGVVYDLNDRFSLYASYADIYRSSGLGLDGRALKASHGVDIEAGLKGASSDGSLNGSLVLYRIKQYDVPVADFSIYPVGFYLGSNFSKGIDAELSGRLQPGWLIGAGYTFNINREADGAALSSATPRHLLKVWTSKQLPGSLHRWTVGGELRAQSANSRSGLICAEPDFTGFCKQDQPYRIEQRAYAIVSLRAGFQIDPHWSAALSVNNVLDKVYYLSIGTPQSENWYGDPRSFLLRIDGRY